MPLTATAMAAIATTVTTVVTAVTAVYIPATGKIAGFNDICGQVKDSVAPGATGRGYESWQRNFSAIAPASKRKTTTHKSASQRLIKGKGLSMHLMRVASLWLSGQIGFVVLWIEDAGYTQPGNIAYAGNIQHEVFQRVGSFGGRIGNTLQVR